MAFNSKTDWKYDEVVMERDLNRIEKGIEDAHTAVENIQKKLTPEGIGAETPAGAQNKVAVHEGKGAPHADHVKGNMRITVSTTAPANPSKNDIWIVI
ncbi:hypothetical protein B9C88_21400 [Brevibacillus laterosporus]|uniref:hypothetical protein n=1 Tax=Brevibacillus laterosporus TaxID=1465 RepID=UPI000BC700C2|nr:hypothetical protein [Brevibacillus laterosporus]PCN42259.1 hypothetical protein B9C88_21400 [Brevibacillus laterosporus]